MLGLVPFAMRNDLAREEDGFDRLFNWMSQPIASIFSDTGFDMFFEHDLGKARERPGSCIDLGYYVNAVAVVLDHFADASYLPFDPRQAV